VVGSTYERGSILVAEQLAIENADDLHSAKKKSSPVKMKIMGPPPTQPLRPSIMLLSHDGV